MEKKIIALAFMAINFIVMTSCINEPVDISDDTYIYRLIENTAYAKASQVKKNIIDYYTDPLAGLSLRPLEAMFLEKKLITNNVTIRNYDFYSDHNIFICQDGFDGIRDFIAKPYQSVNKKIRERYLFSFWRSSF